MTRALDIVLSASAILLLLPLFVLIIIVLSFTGEGEIFYVQERVGREGKIFGLYKFATMLKNSPNMGTGTVTVKDDPRTLPFGRFLRRTKFNELPQLINVLKGDLSIVGPRPQVRRCFDAFPKTSQVAIVKVRPGLSGLGSIFFRNEEDLLRADRDPQSFYDNVIMPYKGQLEEWYVDNQSLTLYLQCILVTCIVLIAPRISDHLHNIFTGLPVPPEPLRRDLQASNKSP